MTCSLTFYEINSTETNHFLDIRRIKRRGARGKMALAPEEGDRLRDETPGKPGKRMHSLSVDMSILFKNKSGFGFSWTHPDNLHPEMIFLILQRRFDFVIFHHPQAFDLLDQIFNFFIIIPPLDGLADDGNDIRNVERLGDKVNGPVTNGFMGIGKGSESGDNDDRRIQVKTLDLPKDLDAVKPRHL